MRILFVSSSSGSRGGGEFFIVYLAEALKQLGLEVGLWMSDDPQMHGIASLFEKTGPVFRNPYKNTFLRKTRSFSHLMPLGSGLDKIRNQWSKFRPDVIHLNKQCLEDGLDLLQLADSQHTPHGCTIHITQTAVELKAFMAPLRDHISRRALTRYGGELWAIAKNRGIELQQFIGDSKQVKCIPNGVRIPVEDVIERERERMRSEYAERLKTNGSIAVSVGRLEQQKDPFRFLEIVSQWKSREPNLSAIWVGDGSLREAFEKQISKMGAGDWINCVGWQEDAAPFLCIADVYVHPARFEGLPFALLEAMAHGLPCVISPELAADLTDIPRDIWILATENSADWLPKLLDPQALRKRGMQTRELAKQSFSTEAMARSYIGLYEGLLKQKAKGVK